MSREPSLPEVLSSSFNKQMTNIFTAMPGIVVTVRNELNDMTLDVQPTLNIKTKNQEVTERPVIVNVPLQFPASSTAALTYPINVGDSVLLIFSMRGLDTWKRGNGRNVTPTDFRKFDKRDCFAIPGVFPSTNSINDPAKRVWNHNTRDTVLVNSIGTAQETEIRILESGGIVINTNQDVTTNCKNMVANVEQNTTINTNNLVIDSAESIDITTTTLNIAATTTTWSGGITHVGSLEHIGSYNGTGTQTFNGVVFSTHKHGASPPPSN